MRTIPWLAGCIISLLATVNANVEKAIFLAPAPIALTNVLPAPGDLHLHALSPGVNSILSTRLPVTFPTAAAAPHGLESWYLLRGLDEGRRYEVRICWPATQPTDFWLDTYTPAQIFDTPALISSLAAHSELRKELGDEPLGTWQETSQSLLFLRIQSAASFYSLNKTLMDHPPPVDADIILDPFLLNILPQSLGPTAIYIAIVAIGAWFLSGAVFRWLLSIATDSPKPHTD